MKKTLIIVTIFIVLVGVYFLGRITTEQSINERGVPGSRSTNVDELSSLNLSNRNLNAIPTDVFNRTNLVELDVSQNSITGAIQADIRQLRNLKVLNASNNQMTGVPAEIGQLENLEILDLSNNKITGLPLEIGSLKKIKTINLSGNDYSKYDLDLIRQKLPNVNFILD